MKLESKHIAPYLPYGVKMKCLYSGDCDELTGITYLSGRGSVSLHYQIKSESSSRFELYDFEDFEHMPILRPMVDLRNDKESIVELKLFVHADLLWTIDGAINGSYESVQYLLSKHYDIFGLIEAGLAVDINTLNK